MKKELIETVHYYLKGGKVVFTLFYYIEEVDNTDQKGELACAGGACEIV